jgi:protein-tyrosine phosphatase
MSTRGLFLILYVCTGNICRSPMAERLTRAGLARRLGPQALSFRVESAGTWGHEGSPMEPYAAQVLTDRGVVADDFVGRELAPEHVLGADLILAATRDHRDQVLAVDGLAGPRTFTLREFARLAGSVDRRALPVGDLPARARALVDAAETLRRRVPPAGAPASAYDDDIEDPLGAPLHVYRLCASRIADAVDSMLDTIARADTRRVV